MATYLWARSWCVVLCTLIFDKGPVLFSKILHFSNTLLESCFMLVKSESRDYFSGSSCASINGMSSNFSCLQDVNKFEQVLAGNQILTVQEGLRWRITFSPQFNCSIPVKFMLHCTVLWACKWWLNIFLIQKSRLVARWNCLKHATGAALNNIHHCWLQIISLAYMQCKIDHKASLFSFCVTIMVLNLEQTIIHCCSQRKLRQWTVVIIDVNFRSTWLFLED